MAGLGRRGSPWAIAVAIALTALALTASAAGSDGPAGRQVTVASGHVGDLTSKVGIRGDGDKRCFSVFALSGGFQSGSTVCGEEVPDQIWRPITGAGGDEPSDPAVRLELTSRRVLTLRLLLAFSDHTAWRTLHPRLLTRRQASIARLPRDFRFVTVAEPAAFCVKAVQAIGRGGRVLIDEAVPCER